MAAVDPPQTQECEQIAAAPESSSSAISQLFREHNRLLVGYLMTRLRSEQEAKDVAQEAYVRLLQQRGPYDRNVLRAYLFKIATNLAIDRLRHRRLQQCPEDHPLWLEGELNTTNRESDDPARQLLAREQATQLLGYLQELPVKCQQVFSLHRVDGISQREVARRLGFSERMVRRYVTYAMIYCNLRSEGMTADQVRRKVSL